MAKGFHSIDEYIATFPAEVRYVLQEVRSTLHRALPEATEAISYQIPTFRVESKNVVHFAGWRKHISVYPIPAGDAEFQAQIEQYRSGKGTLKYPLTHPIPYELIAQVAKLLAIQHAPE